MKPSELNPDYVKFRNDKKKKKTTILHLEQKLSYELKQLDYDRKWLRNRMEDVKKQEQRIQGIRNEICKIENSK